MTIKQSTTPPDSTADIAQAEGLDIRPGESPAVAAGDTEAILALARRHYQQLSAALQENIAGLQAQGSEEARQVIALILPHWKAVQTLLELEIKLEERRRDSAGIVQGYAIDLAQAVAEVGSRLARLRGGSAD